MRGTTYTITQSLTLWERILILFGKKIVFQIEASWDMTKKEPELNIYTSHGIEGRFHQLDPNDQSIPVRRMVARIGDHG